MTDRQKCFVEMFGEERRQNQVLASIFDSYTILVFLFCDIEGNLFISLIQNRRFFTFFFFKMIPAERFSENNGFHYINSVHRVTHVIEVVDKHYHCRNSSTRIFVECQSSVCQDSIE